MATAYETNVSGDGYGRIIRGRSIAVSTSKSGKNEALKSTRVGLGRDVCIVKRKEPIVQNLSANNIGVQRESVSATVLRDEDISVLCEVEMHAGTVHINLPKSLFPAKLYYGMPISIRFEEEASGIRKPSISLRQIDDELLQQENEEMRALVETF